MKKLILIFSLLFTGTLQAQNAKNLDELLQRVKTDQIAQRPELKQREQEFLQKKNEQKKLLDQARRELSAEEAVTTRLTKEFETNEKELSELETRLNLVMGTLGELFGVVKQIAGDTKAQLEASVISAEFPGRAAFPSDLAQRKVLPSVPELEKLWYLLQQEMTESGKVSQFEAEVVSPDGERHKQKVTRVGSFNLVTDGKYAFFQPETQQITELARQPSGRYLGLVDDLEDADEAVVPFGIDPSRGVLLSMLVQSPSFFERIGQGGIVGHIIIVILFLGAGLVGERIYTLNRQKKLIEAQLQSSQVLPGNPLGVIMKVFEENKAKDIETLELKLDEAIMRVTPPLERGNSTLKVLVGVAPLLGLLGTVTGMIVTFQSITLFGTGDPKLMAGGISQALVTTVEGLVCAIPLLLLHNYISGKSKALIQLLEEQSAGLLAKKAEGKN
jgi:biopolymer transport protein ExbB